MKIIQNLYQKIKELFKSSKKDCMHKDINSYFTFKSKYKKRNNKYRLSYDLLEIEYCTKCKKPLSKTCIGKNIPSNVFNFATSKMNKNSQKQWNILNPYLKGYEIFGNTEIIISY